MSPAINMPRGTKKAGEFKASCKIGAKGNDRELTFSDPALFEEHMLAAHGAKPGQTIRARVHDFGVPLAPPSWVRLAFKQLLLGKGNWSAPKLTKAGKDFKPAELAPGAHVDWMQGDSTFGQEIARSGQVWCAGSRAGTAWVIPLERFVGESAVLLEQLASGRLAYVQTYVSRTAVA